MAAPEFDPDDSRRRRQRTFARWFDAVSASPPDCREAVASVCRRIARGGMTTADTLSAIDCLDELLSDALGRPADEDD